MEENSCSFTNPGPCLTWVSEEIDLIFIGMYDSILSGLSTLFNAIPVPGFLDISGANFSIPADVLYYVAPFELAYGASVIVAAYTARFILRRIPGIG